MYSRTHSYDFRLTTQGDGLREVVSGRHMLEALIPYVEEEVTGRAGKTHDRLAGLSAGMPLRIRRGHLVRNCYQRVQTSPCISILVLFYSPVVL